MSTRAAVVDPAACPACGSEICENADHQRRVRETADAGFPDAELEDATTVAREGQQIARDGVPYVVADMVPNLGTVGFNVAFSKVGKTTFGQALGGAVAGGRPFLGKATTRARVLVLAVEDPPAYTAWLARHLDVEPGWMTFRRRPLVLTTDALTCVCATVRQGGYGLVLIASWQAAVRGLIRDENDNAGMVRVVEEVKAAARRTGVPWLIDAHSGKGEDQHDDADPSRAMRGASAAAAAADYTLSLRYANGAFGTQRRLSGKGRFVAFEPITIDFDATSGTYTPVTSGKDALRESTWQLIVTTGALATAPRTASEIAFAAGLRNDQDRVTSTHRRQVADALRSRPTVGLHDELRRGQKTTLYRLLEEA